MGRFAGGWAGAGRSVFFVPITLKPRGEPHICPSHAREKLR